MRKNKNKIVNQTRSPIRSGTAINVIIININTKKIVPPRDENRFPVPRAFPKIESNKPSNAFRGRPAEFTI